MLDYVGVCVCDELHVLACEVGVKMMPNVKLSSQREIKGGKETITVTESAWFAYYL